MGSGVTVRGAQNLAKKLACMTVGDLDALLQIKDIDPVKVALLLKEIQDLAKALVCHDIYINKTYCRISNFKIALQIDRWLGFYYLDICLFLFTKCCVWMNLSLFTYHVS